MMRRCATGLGRASMARFGIGKIGLASVCVLPSVLPPPAALGGVRLFSATGSDSSEDFAVMSKLAHLDVGGMPMEARLKWIKDLFQQLDADGDGVITLADLKLLPDEVASLADDVTALFDRDGRGQVTLQEFAYGITLCVQLASRTSHSRQHYDRVMFALMDEDANGTLEYQEVRTWLKAAQLLGLVRSSYATEGGAELSTTQLADKMFADFSALCSGDSTSITYDEFVQLSGSVLDYTVFERNTMKDME